MAEDRRQLILPTGINVITAVNNVLITRGRAGLTPEIYLPSLRRRALLVVGGIGTLTIHLDLTVTSAVSPNFRV